jgi:hypothetical protein
VTPRPSTADSGPSDTYPSNRHKLTTSLLTAVGGPV